MWDLQRDFDAWLDTLDNQLVLENGIPMVEGVPYAAVEEMERAQDGVAVPEVVKDVVAVIEGVQDVAAELEGVEDVDVKMDGEDVAAEIEGEDMHEFDVLTAGEQVIFDVMFDLYHPNIYLDDNGFYRFLED
jgi:hypothetical protein